MKKVLVACLENWDTLQELPFVLQKGGCSVKVYCSKKSWLISNSYYDHWIECSDDADTYIKELIALVKNNPDKYDWIIPADEKLIQVLNNAITSEQLFYKIMPLSKIGNREMLASKAGLSRVCEKYGILSPKYLVYSHKNGLDTDSFNLNYPVLLKQDLSWGGGGILLCENQEQFDTNLKKTSPDYDTIIQEYITGKDIGVEALFRNGELIEYNAGEVSQYFDSKFNFTTKRNYCNSKRMSDELSNIGSHLGVNGFASIQFIYKPEEDNYYLLEVDTRPNFFMPYGRFTGHDFSEAVKKYLNPDYKAPVGKQGTNTTERKVTEVALFYRDIIRCVKQKDIKGFSKWIFNYGHYWNYIPTYDKVLFKRILNELFIHKTLVKIKGLFKLKTEADTILSEEGAIDNLVVERNMKPGRKSLRHSRREGQSV